MPAHVCLDTFLYKHIFIYIFSVRRTKSLSPDKADPRRASSDLQMLNTTPNLPPALPVRFLDGNELPCCSRTL